MGAMLQSTDIFDPSKVTIDQRKLAAHIQARASGVSSESVFWVSDERYVYSASLHNPPDGTTPDRAAVIIRVPNGLWAVDEVIMDIVRQDDGSYGLEHRPDDAV